MKLNYRKDIDGIRALAVLSVVFFHAFPKLIPGGYIGVDIFFVLSGYLISNIIFHQVENKQFSWTAFYINRINRIFPALIVILISALISGYFLLFSDEYQNLNKHILGSTFFLNNIMLWKES
jgi:peptidoglycan/LPS O-acetylase OafA/YrhL